MKDAVRLNNGVEMPLLGLGTWKLLPHQAEKAVMWALEAGYRHIDTARIYMNEGAVGKAIKNSGVPTSELFVVTKLWNSDHGYENAIKACNASLRRLGLSYVNLYLIHFPVSGKRLESWRGMEQLYKEAKCKAIGVSNFTIRHLKELLAVCKVKPMVNQVEFNPYLYQKELLDFCVKNRIQLEAYSPLTTGKKLDDEKLVAIAKKYGKTASQIILRWCIQHEVVAIPKSKSKERIEENFRVFDFKISAADMRLLDGFNENLRLCWDPTDVP